MTLAATERGEAFVYTAGVLVTPAASKLPGGNPASLVSWWNSRVSSATVPGCPASDDTRMPLHDAGPPAAEAVLVIKPAVSTRTAMQSAFLMIPPRVACSPAV